MAAYEFAFRKDLIQYGVPMTEVPIRQLYITLTWFLKVIPAVYSDRYGVDGQHRRPYMFRCNLCASIVCFVLAAAYPDEPVYIFLLFLFNFFVCFADVNYDACIVMEAQKEEKNKGDTQTIMWIARDCGQALGEFIGPVLWNAMGSAGVYASLGSVSLSASLMALLYQEEKRRGIRLKKHVEVKGVVNLVDFATDDSILVSGGEVSWVLPETSLKFGQMFSLVKKTVLHPMLFPLLCFNLFSSLFPNSGLALFYYLTGPMNFTPKDMGVLGSISAGGRVLGAVFYRFIRRYSIRTVYLIVGFLSVIVSVMPIFIGYRMKFQEAANLVGVERATYVFQNATGVDLALSEILGLNSFVFALSDDTLGSILDTIRNMPVLNVTSIVCARAVEASAYATVLSLLNAFSGLRRLIDMGILAAFGITYTDFDNLYKLLILCSAFELFSVLLAFTPLVPAIRIDDVKEFSEDKSIDIQESRTDRAETPVNLPMEISAASI